MNNVAVGMLTLVCGVYPSTTRRNGEFVLWHPDRNFFLLGKRITNGWPADLRAPSE